MFVKKKVWLIMHPVVIASLYGLIFVLAGIDANLKEKAVKLIDEQLKAMQDGEITDLEINQTKSMLTNQLKEAMDSARAQIEIYDQYKELNEDFTVEDWIGKWSDMLRKNKLDKWLLK